MSGKDCGNHGQKLHKKFRRIFVGILILLFIVLVTVLLVWAILQPKKPLFILQDATLYTFNVSSPHILTSVFQVTVSSCNPNDKIGVYYDKLDIYASYRNQQITLRTQIPPSYQGHKEIDVWSPYVSGTEIPVAPYNAEALSQDQGCEQVLVMFKIDGRIRFKVGSFITGKYRLYVKCPAYIQFGSRSNGIIVGNNAVKFQLVQSCSVSV